MQELGEDEWNLHKDGQPAKILIPDPQYHNLKTQLLKNLVKHDDLPAAVGERDFKNRHGNETVLQSHNPDFVSPAGALPPPDDALLRFGQKFSINDLARTLLLATLLKDESPNSIAEATKVGQYIEELNLSGPVEIGEVSEGELSENSEMIRKDFYLKFRV